MRTSADDEGRRRADAEGSNAWPDALLAAACIAVDPVGLGGVRLRAAPGPARDEWMRRWRAWLPPGTPVRQVPLSADDGRLFGGLDLGASLRAGRPIASAGLFAEIVGGYAILAMAERVDDALAARVAARIESGACAVVACDEGDDDEDVATALDERLALAVDLRAVSVAALSTEVGAPDDAAVSRARTHCRMVDVGDDCIAALCGTAAALGVRSLRMAIFAVRVARVVAALDGRDAADMRDAIVAARLVLGPRATSVAQPESPESPEPSESPELSDAHESPTAEAPPDQASAPGQRTDPSASESATEASPSTAPDPSPDVVLQATLATLPAGLLDTLVRGAGAASTSRGRTSGAGASARGGRRGAPAGVRRGRPDGTSRLSLIDTLRAAAPWQRVRQAEADRDGRGESRRIRVRADDLHVVRHRRRQATTTVFVVDASGSSALHRLAEAKGAVERLLADCYVRRDSVAVLAFRGRAAETLLPPTRSLVRARRALAGLPGGGGTPLASALDATRETVAAIRRHGDTVLVVLLTDGRANVARDGAGGRPRAEADALAAAKSLRELGVPALLIDTSANPSPVAARLADAMGAAYRPLPHADALALSAAVQEVGDSTRRRRR